MATIRNQNKGKIITIGTIAVILVTLIAISLFNYINALRTDNSQKNLATEIAYIGQGVLRSSSTVLEKYNEESYRQISESRNKLNMSIDMLSKGGILSNGVEVPAPTEYLSNQITSFQSVVNDIVTNINFIINEKNDALVLRDKKEKYDRLNSKLLESLSYLASSSSVESKVSNGNISQYLSLIGNTYNQLSIVQVKDFADNKNMLNEDYLSEQNNALQIINQQVSEIARLNEIVKGFNMPANEKNNLLNDINKIYTIAQELKQESNAIMEVLPKIVTAQKYADQTDKLAVRLDDAYAALSFSLLSTHNNSTIWLISFVIFSILLIGDVLYLINLAGKSSNITESKKGEKRFRDYYKKVHEALGQLIYGGKLRSDIQIKDAALTTGDKFADTQRIIREIALHINTERKDFNSFLRELNSDTSMLAENMNSIINTDSEFNKKVDILLPLIDDVRTKLNEVYQFSTEMNVEGTKNNIAHSNEKINETISGFNKLKETMQETNKSIKKVSETTQGMNEGFEDIRKIADMMQINALNTQVITDFIVVKANDTELLEETIKINNYIKNVKDLSIRVIDILSKLELLNSATAKDTGEAIRSLENNIQEIVSGGESISKIQNLLGLINKDLKNASQRSAKLSEKTMEGISQLEIANKEFKETKNNNRESIEDKNKMLLKIKVLDEKISEKKQS